MIPELDPALIRRLLDRAFREDLGDTGDISAQATIDAGATATATLVIRAAGTLAGLPLAVEAFRNRDPNVQITTFVRDGQSVEAGFEAVLIRGNARAILTAERTALNFLGHLSGIATATNHLVNLVSGTRARVVDTRKTTPGLRALEKYAVRCGGGTNHRIGLYDAVMIKDNHILVNGSITEAVRRARAEVGHLVKIEVEVSDLHQLEEAIAAGSDVVMLDNMSPEEVHQAVKLTAGRVILEASGGINATTIRAFAETGVDVISVGAITHSAPNLDVALDVQIGS
jgi:nicotinate-nucleotide pyrophosphorylase (carboxylating)